jgi:hypothetical protein
MKHPGHTYGGFVSAISEWGMIVSSPRGDMHARHVFPKVSILIGGVEFLANLIVLKSKGINMILGLDWLSKHTGLLTVLRRQ